MEEVEYKIGDLVEIINYGSLFWQSKKSGEPKSTFKLVSENESVWVFDMHPELIGKQGTICMLTSTQGITSYAIDGIKGKHAWYSKGQLMLIVAAPKLNGYEISYDDLPQHEQNKLNNKNSLM